MQLRIPAMLGGLLLGIMTAPVQALDPPTVQGHLQYGKQRYELRYAQAVRNPDNPKRLWILLTTAELSVKDAADLSRTLKLAMDGKLRGVRLNVDAAAPKASELQGALLLSKDESPGGEVVFGAGGRKFWERLTLGDKRIVGKLRYVSETSSPAWMLEFQFSAPIFNAR
jgi:hypothetical protein